MRLLSPQSNGSSPLRTTNFIFDNKQQTIIRTGNISPAHSDSSSESTSTCSSDEQLHHHHHYHFHQPQPWRSYREREKLIFNNFFLIDINHQHYHLNKQLVLFVCHILKMDNIFVYYHVNMNIIRNVLHVGLQ
jgi:hypothetical protein